MTYLRERPGLFCCLPILILLVGCGPKPECDSFETRNAVLKVVLDDHGNRLGVFAAQNSTVKKDGSDREGVKPLYTLGEKMVTNSTGQDGRTLKCSGSLSATVGETKASKEIEYTVQQAKNGELSVSVTPFQF